MQENEVVIAIMGATGTGKSTFINLVSGTSFGVGDGLKSCTSSVAYSHSFQLGGRKVVLIDTPGFDDTTISDTDILKMIALHLTKTYELGIKLSGVIYLQRISDMRMGGISRRNFNMFRKLCGEDTLQNVLIVTTMWGLLIDPQKGEDRERELRTDKDLFKPVFEKGARMVRHYNTVESAQQILSAILNNHPVPLRIQRELVEEGKDISQTGAGEELNSELAAMAKKYQEDLRQVKEEMQEALTKKDEMMKEELEEQRQELEASMKKIDFDRERLSKEYVEEKKRADEEMQKIMAALEAEKKARELGKQEFEKLRRELADNSKKSAEEQQQLRDRIDALKARQEAGFFETLGHAFTALFSGRF